MAKLTQEKKLEVLKDWLRENNLPFEENHKSGYGVMMDVKIPSLMIAVFVSNGEREWESSRYNATTDGRRHLYGKYKPFFIRPTDTKAFTLEKIQNCCRDRMIWMQKKYMMDMDRQAKEGEK